MKRGKGPRVRQFALAYESDTGPSVFLHPLFSKTPLASIKTLRDPHYQHRYLTIITYARPITRRAFQRFLNAYMLQRSTPSLFCQCDTYASFGGIVAGVSERTQVPEAMAFAECKLQFKLADPALIDTTILLSTTPKGNKPNKPSTTTLDARFTTFFLHYKAVTALDTANICFQILHIKSITTVPWPSDPSYFLSYIVMHNKRSESLILKCIQEFNYWHFHSPIDLHPTHALCVRIQKVPYAACRRSMQTK